MNPKSQDWRKKPSGSSEVFEKIDKKSLFVARLQNIDLRKRIIAIRHHYDLSAVAMSKIVGKSVQQLQRYEYGLCPINYDVRKKYMELTGLPENYFKEVFKQKGPKCNKATYNFLMNYDKPFARLYHYRNTIYQGTVEELARALGICSYYLHCLENDRFKLTMKVADRIAEFTELPISVFYDG